MDISKSQINYLKGLAIIAVVVIHIIPNLFSFYANNRPVTQLLIIFDQILRFSVPFFVAISGYSLAKRYLGEKINIKEFYFHRAFKLFPLYFFWVGIIFLTGAIMPSWAGFRGAFPEWQWVFWGRAEYHLYFVPMILQFYLLFPLLLFLTRRFNKFSLAAAFMAEIIIYLVLNPHQSFADQKHYIIFSTWVFYFILGIYLGQYKITINKNIKLLIFGLVTGGLFWVLIDALHLFYAGENLIVINRFTRVPVIFYGVGAFLGILTWMEKVTNISKTITRVITFVGEKSYIVYLGHTIVIRIIFEIAWHPSINANLLMVIIITFLAFSLSEVINSPGMFFKRVLPA